MNTSVKEAFGWEKPGRGQLKGYSSGGAKSENRSTGREKRG